MSFTLEASGVNWDQRSSNFNILLTQTMFLFPRPLIPVQITMLERVCDDRSPVKFSTKIGQAQKLLQCNYLFTTTSIIRT